LGGACIGSLRGDHARISSLSGFSSLIAYSMTARIQKSMNVHERTDWAEYLFDLIYAVFGEDKKYAQGLFELSEDLKKLREEYSDVMDYESWAITDRNRYNLYLDHIQRRLLKIVKNTGIIDSAGLKEMVVPE
jgi:hypothetical protein